MNFDEYYSSEEWYYKLPPSEELEEFLGRGSDFGGQSALDVGCGEGRDSILLASKGFSVVSVDASSSAIKKLSAFALKNGLKIDTRQADATQLDLPANSYDVICAVTLFDHLNVGDGRKLASKLTRALRPGGFLFVEVFTTSDPGYLGGEASETAHFIRHYFSPGELRDLFSELKEISYVEQLEEDATHGPVHMHGVAILLAKKV